MRPICLHCHRGQLNHRFLYRGLSIICSKSYMGHLLSSNSHSYQECKARPFCNIISLSQKSNRDNICHQHSKHNTHSPFNRLNRQQGRCGEMFPSKQQQLMLIEISLLALNKHISTELLIQFFLLIKTLENNKEKCNLLIIIKSS